MKLSLAEQPATTSVRQAVRDIASVGAAMVAALAMSIPTAHADRLRDRVQADSFGNLMVWSSSGYKRIVVGRGNLAGKLKAYVGDTEALDFEDADGTHSEDGEHDQSSGNYRRAGDDWRRNCYRPPVFVKGRGYMYGLADGEMPELSTCLPYND